MDKHFNMPELFTVNDEPTVLEMPEEARQIEQFVIENNSSTTYYLVTEDRLTCLNQEIRDLKSQIKGLEQGRIEGERLLEESEESQARMSEQIENQRQTIVSYQDDTKDLKTRLFHALHQRDSNRKLVDYLQETLADQVMLRPPAPIILEQQHCVEFAASNELQYDARRRCFSLTPDLVTDKENKIEQQQAVIEILEGKLQVAHKDAHEQQSQMDALKRTIGDLKALLQEAQEDVSILVNRNRELCDERNAMREANVAHQKQVEILKANDERLRTYIKNAQFLLNTQNSYEIVKKYLSAIFV